MRRSVDDGVRSAAGLLLVALGAACERVAPAPSTPGPGPLPRAASGIEPSGPRTVAAGAVTAAVVAAGAVAAAADSAVADSARPAPGGPARAAGPPARKPAGDSVSLDVTSAEIVREVATVFGDSAPPPTDTSAAPPGAPVWDIDVRSYETHVRVEHFVEAFSGRAKAAFERSVQRQTRYGALIRERLMEGGLPEDLTYLALIESGYDPHAYSRAAAVGMWQFMAGTARGVGLRVDWWVDERRDPVRATEGAVRLLKALREQFGSLFLAAAAYNGGNGRVARGLARYATALDGVEGDDRFFTLADRRVLRPETRDYVPKLIAAALVGKEPGRYGVVVESLPPFGYDSVRVGGAVPLAAVAGAAPADVAMLKELNSQLLRGMTPPRESLWVRVPVGRAEGFDARYAALDSAERVAVTRVTSKKGESITSIARKHGLTAKQLNWYNPKVVRLKSGNLSAGQAILVPSRATVLAAMDVPNPSIERYPRRSSASARRTHLVRRGETLDGIARRYGTSAATLMRLNGLRKALIVPGQSLVVRAPPAPRAAAAKSKAPVKTPPKAAVRKTP